MIIKICAVILMAIFFPSSSTLSRQLRKPGTPLEQRTPHYLQRTWTSEQGLPQNSILAITQTNDGFLWLGTQAGLTRFDGSTFKVFHKNNTPALKDNFITTLLTARDSTLWIGTEAGGLVAMKNYTFTTYTAESGLLDKSIRALYEGHDGALWVGTHRGGVFKFQDGRFTQYAAREGLSNLNIGAIFEDHSKTLWVGTMGGLQKLESGTFKALTTKDGLPSNLIETILEDSSHALWVGTYNGGVSKYANGHFTTFHKTEGLSKNEIKVLYSDRLGTMWVGTYAGGLNRFDGKSFWPFVTSELSSTSVITALFEDREGNIWVGTNGDGLHCLKKSRVITYNKQTGLSADGVWGVYEDQHKNVWIGLDGNGVNKLSEGTITSYSKKDGLKSDNVFSIIEDHTGTVWLGTEFGINKWKNGVFTSLSVSDGYPPYARAIYEDREHRIWIGANTIYKIEQNTVTMYTAAEGFSKSPPVYFLEDRSGNLWIATDGGGVSKFSNGTFTNYTTNDGLTDNTALCIYEDRQGGICVGTFGGGINRFSNGVWKAWTQQQGLPDGVIYQIVKDNYGTCWMSSNQGVFSVSEEKMIDFFEAKISSLVPFVLDRLDGMGSNECSGAFQSAGFKGRNGNIWFPTVKGAITIDPRQVQTNPLPPPVVISEVNVDNETIIPEGFREIGPGMEKIEFHYAGLSFTAPTKVRYQYKLDGFDKTWVNAGMRNIAYYTALSPGKYAFQVRACNNDGVWNETGASFEFRVMPQFYQTMWFYSLCLLGVVGSGFTLYRIRLWQLLKRERELTYRVDEALKKIKVLGGLIPICSHCKKIRDDKGYWNQLEKYLDEHSEASFSHGICPECAEEFYGDLLKRNKGSSLNPPEL